MALLWYGFQYGKMVRKEVVGVRNKPWTQSARNEEWARLYREEGLSFHAIAQRAGVGYSVVRETVTSFFTRRDVIGWRRCCGVR